MTEEMKKKSKSLPDLINNTREEERVRERKRERGREREEERERV